MASPWRCPVSSSYGDTYSRGPDADSTIPYDGGSSPYDGGSSPGDGRHQPATPGGVAAVGTAGGRRRDQVPDRDRGGPRRARADPSPIGEGSRGGLRPCGRGRSRASTGGT